MERDSLQLLLLRATIPSEQEKSQMSSDWPESSKARQETGMARMRLSWEHPQSIALL